MSRSIDLLNPRGRENKTVVRLKSSYWSKGSVAFVKREIRTLKRKTIGPDLVQELGGEGAETLLEMIVNLHECPDGIYELRLINVSRDWESGHIDDFDLQLVQHFESP